MIRTIWPSSIALTRMDDSVESIYHGLDWNAAYPPFDMLWKMIISIRSYFFRWTFSMRNLLPFIQIQSVLSILRRQSVSGCCRLPKWATWRGELRIELLCFSSLKRCWDLLYSRNQLSSDLVSVSRWRSNPRLFYGRSTNTCQSRLFRSNRSVGDQQWIRIKTLQYDFAQ